MRHDIVYHDNSTSMALVGVLVFSSKLAAMLISHFYTHTQTLFSIRFFLVLSQKNSPHETTNKAKNWLSFKANPPNQTKLPPPKWDVYTIAKQHDPYTYVMHSLVSPQKKSPSTSTTMLRLYSLWCVYSEEKQAKKKITQKPAA